MAKTKKDIIEEEIQSVYIDPLTDFGFKKIFLDRELLIAFLNDVVGTNFRDCGSKTFNTQRYGNV